MEHRHPQSEETRAKISAARKAYFAVPENREKQSAAHMGHSVSPETREKLSAMRVGLPHPISPETRLKISATMWKGGEPVSSRKSKAKRRTLGFIPLNEPFLGCEAHHLDHDRIVYMPKALHHSIFHRQRDGYNMEQINALAYEWLAKNP